MFTLRITAATDQVIMSYLLYYYVQIYFCKNKMFTAHSNASAFISFVLIASTSNQIFQLNVLNESVQYLSLNCSGV